MIVVVEVGAQRHVNNTSLACTNSERQAHVCLPVVFAPTTRLTTTSNYRQVNVYQWSKMSNPNVPPHTTNSCVCDKLPQKKTLHGIIIQMKTDTIAVCLHAPDARNKHHRHNELLLL